jgi:hypothetical protein
VRRIDDEDNGVVVVVVVVVVVRYDECRANRHTSS